MRYLLCLLLAHLCAAEAEPVKVKPLPREDITLADGRMLTGTYDEAATLLTLDGGIMALKVLPEQITKRAPAKVAAEAKLSAKTMTAEEKAEAIAGFKEGKQQAAIVALENEANKAEQHAAELMAKSKNWDDQAKVAAKSFRHRASLEGEHFSMESILTDKLVTKQTMASNLAILHILARAQQLTADAVAEKAVAKKKRAEAERLRGTSEGER